MHNPHNRHVNKQPNSYYYCKTCQSDSCRTVEAHSEDKIENTASGTFETAPENNPGRRLEWVGVKWLFGTTTAWPRHIHTHTLTQYATTPCKPVCELTRGQNGGYLVTNTSRTGLGFPPPSVAKQGLKEAWGVRSTHRITRRLAFVFNLLRINTYEI